MLRGALCIGLVVALAPACESEPPDPYLPLLEKHAGHTDPPPDTSNKYALDPAAQALGKKLYFDPNFAGVVIGKDMLLRDMTTAPREPLGASAHVSCNSCHDVTMGGSDHTTTPGNVVSFGAGAYDVNSQQTINSAYADIIYWNGRNDSLWSQIMAVVESHVSVNSNRLRIAWRLIDKYRSEYAAVFPEWPLPPELDDLAMQKSRLNPDGTCVLDGSNACPAYCHNTYGPCLPRYPLDGRQGYVELGELPHCDWADPALDPVLQPYKDAWDCMKLEDQLLATRIFVNFAKSIAAYEFTLISKDSPFDKWADAGFPAGMLSPAAERGARLFVGKAACAECHEGPMFSDWKFHAIGVPQLGTYVPTKADCPAGGWCDCVTNDSALPENCLPNGARDGLRKLRANRFRRDSAWSDDEECRRHFTLHVDANYNAAHPTECDGKVKYYGLTFDDSMVGQWRTPSLRDVAITAPYMHDGVYANLRDVIVHYNKGGVHSLGGETLGTIDEKIKVLNLTDQEIDDVVAFLETLTGQVDPAVIEMPVVPPASAF
ncbi:MAG TPA: cytochrome c peroxidase [Kofleriaceae bacterium]|nr:cytochrome c peroxidase [Kofleriaceae bacterium]